MKTAAQKGKWLNPNSNLELEFIVFVCSEAGLACMVS